MKNQSTLTVKQMLALSFTIISTIVLFFWIYFASETKNIGFNNESVNRLEGTFLVTHKSASDESTLETALPSHLETAKAGDAISISRILHASELTGNCLAFYLQQSWADIYLDNELLLETDRTPALPFPLSAGSHWYVFRLPNDFEGKELRIELTAQFDEYAPHLPEIFTGSKSALMYLILRNASFSLFMGIPTLTLGLTCILLGLLLHKKKITARMTILGILSVTISIWYLLESRITQLLFGNIFLFSFLLFACYNLIPVLMTALLLTFDTFKKQKYISVLFWLSCFCFIIVQLLQITGITYYLKMVPTVHILIILIILAVIAGYFHERKSSQPITEMYIYKSLLIFSCFAVIDIIFFYLTPTALIGSASKLGLLIFIIYLVYTALKQFYQMETNLIKNEVYRELAVKDVMTGLANRTAFEGEMSQLREASAQTIIPHVFFLFADVNNLKQINDTYGHEKGDECITETAHLLKQFFPAPSTCYRIGGDEFCIICHNITEEELISREKELHAMAAQRNKETIYPYSIACGYHILDKDGVDACLKKADTAMYQHKVKSKKENRGLS